MKFTFKCGRALECGWAFSRIQRAFVYSSSGQSGVISSLWNEFGSMSRPFNFGWLINCGFTLESQFSVA